MRGRCRDESRENGEQDRAEVRALCRMQESDPGDQQVQLLPCLQGNPCSKRERDAEKQGPKAQHDPAFWLAFPPRVPCNEGHGVETLERGAWHERARSRDVHEGKDREG